jgi:hypothetical protein
MENKRILFIGEIVGKAGVYCIKNRLQTIKKEKQIDFVIANGEGTTGGFGIGKNHSIYLHKLGIDVITAGECVFYKKDMVTHIPKASYMLRAANYPKGTPGRGWWIYEKDSISVGVINLLGQSGFNRTHLSNPFLLAPEIVSKVKQQTNIVIVDFHAATTAEKYTMFYHLDGKASAVIGTHFKVQTADESILPGGTGVICDVGRTGSNDSISGLSPSIEIDKFLYQIPKRSQEIWKGLELQGVVLEIDEHGKTVHIERLRESCPDPES